VAILVVVLVIGYVIGRSNDVVFHSPISFQGAANEKGSKKETEARVDQPFEFLYLDTTRVGAYLAQLTGGAYVKQHLAEKVTKKLNGEITLLNTLKGGVSSENENFVEREVTPTAASSFLELVKKLKEKRQIEKGFLHHFNTHSANETVKGDMDANGKVEEGEFVRFRALLRDPIYFEPYLTIHHAATLSALFPTRGKRRGEREFVNRQREAARKFGEQVGRNPRFLLAIKPKQEPDTGEVTYLMPVRFRQLNEERSLQSGGLFTVVGKVTRVFPPQSADDTRPTDPAPAYAYVDSLTRQLWKQPLIGAPKELICRASPACSTRIEESGTHRAARQKEAEKVHNHIEGIRRHMLEALREQTEIKSTGAVILPVAIYK
jgi:hypothetical protein